MVRKEHEYTDRRKLEVDAAIGLLKFSGLNRRKLLVGEKVKKSAYQQNVLRMVYEITNFPSTETRNELALLLGIPQRSIQVWFQNRRQIAKKKESKSYDSSSNNKSIGLINEYQKFVDEKDNMEDEVFDVPSVQLVDIIERCRKNNSH
ncbi:hypothetical protein EDEG_00008 [Edhazardia aedis USNM 41457]|uniref:Homeobox domain-containing protein n=1 Tax=Edhazardia aedis (strain USNM 41457) TaxID=1003232 RepID=J9D9I1_EDHAE|nr:hypothetical protein EDEG_00008 [Edhazardia aedis USNM 41457]|eukprot:EJW04431.1 hypothetical protein EDEG_00008 [Edhazardia aedis USNM 41457]